ncbi:jg22127, partial [Pararge aegeria aegeria]
VKFDLELVRLRVSSAMGAAWLAARQVDYDLPRDDTAFCDVFYTYRSDINGKVNGTHNVIDNVITNNGTSENGDSENGINGNGTNENGVHGCGCSDWSLWS